MPNRSCRTTALAALLWAAWLATASPAGAWLEQKAWIEVRTPHFVVKSLLSEAATLEVVDDLELFRQVVVTLTTAKKTDSPIPTEILLLSRESDFRELGIGGGVAGIFVPGMRRNLIVMRKTKEMSNRHILQHEFVHFLLYNQNERHYPTWFHEGFAEFMATTYVRGDDVIVGSAPEARLGSFSDWPLVGFEKILTVDDSDGWRPQVHAMLYPQSWLAVHYLQLGRGPEHDVHAETKDYLDRLEAGEGPVAAFESAFGVTARDFGRDAKRYLERKKIRALAIPKKNFVSYYEPLIRTVPEAEMALVLGRAASRLEIEERSKAYLFHALELAPESAAARAGLGKWLVEAGDFAAAQPYFDDAVALAPDDPYVQLDVGGYWLARAETEEDEATREQQLRNARKAFVAAWKLDAAIPETYARYGRSYLVDASDVPKAIEMLENARRLLPSNLEIRLWLAEAYRDAGRRDDALALARIVTTWAHDDDETSERAQALVESLEVVEEPAAAKSADREIRVPGSSGSQTPSH